MGTPDGWTRLTLGQVAQWGSGGTPKAGTAAYYDGEIPWAVIGDLTDGFVSSTAARITQLGLAESSAKMVPDGSVLVAMYGSIGKLGLPTIPMATNQAIAFATPHPEVLDRNFLFWYLMSQREILARSGKGATQQNISQTILKSWPIPLPPLDEQRRIVAILEDHLGRLDSAANSLDRSATQVDALQRRAIIEALNDGGSEVTLRDALEDSVGGVWGASPGASEVDVRVLRVTELDRRGNLNPETAALRSITKSQFGRRSLQPGDLLLEKSGGGPTTPVGRVGIVRELDGPSVCSNFMQFMRPDRSRVSPRWLHLYLNALHLSGRTAAMQKASTNIRNIKASEYLELTIRIPSLRDQERTVNHCEAILEMSQRAEQNILQSRHRGTALRRSFLQAAFSGQLTRESISV